MSGATYPTGGQHKRSELPVEPTRDRARPGKTSSRTVVDGRLHDAAALCFRPKRWRKSIRAIGEVCDDRHPIVVFSFVPAQTPLADRLAAGRQER